MREAGAQPDETVMVGDSEVDILTARNAGLWSVGVTYGFAPQTLEQVPPDVLVDTPAELARALTMSPWPEEKSCSRSSQRCYPVAMSRPPAHSPFQDGFAALWHEPALFAAELTWRWCFGLSAWGLALSRPAVSRQPQDLCRRSVSAQHAAAALAAGSRASHLSWQPQSVSCWSRPCCLLGLMLLWAFAATAGRAATLRRLVAMFSADEERRSQLRWEFRPIFTLNLLRAVWTLIALRRC